MHKSVGSAHGCSKDPFASDFINLFLLLITGGGPEKEPFCPTSAIPQVRLHGNFETAVWGNACRMHFLNKHFKSLLLSLSRRPIYPMQGVRAARSLP